MTELAPMDLPLRVYRARLLGWVIAEVGRRGRKPPRDPTRRARYYDTIAAAAIPVLSRARDAATMREQALEAAAAALEAVGATKEVPVCPSAPPDSAPARCTTCNPPTTPTSATWRAPETLS